MKGNPCPETLQSNWIKENKTRKCNKKKSWVKPVSKEFRGCPVCPQITCHRFLSIRIRWELSLHPVFLHLWTCSAVNVLAVLLAFFPIGRHSQIWHDRVTQIIQLTASSTYPAPQPRSLPSSLPGFKKHLGCIAVISFPRKGQTQISTSKYPTRPPSFGSSKIVVSPP